MKIQSDRLRTLVASIFHAAGCQAKEAERIAQRLTEANLVGHDSHGIIRVMTYVQWLGSWLDSYPYYEELSELEAEE